MYSVWLENSQIETTMPTTIAIGPAQLRYAAVLRDRARHRGPRRSHRSTNTTPSHGPIQ